MALVGQHDLQGRSAYQPVIHSQGGRWIAYIGHHGGKALNPVAGRVEDSGTSIVDVSDPKTPRLLSHIPGEPGEGETGGAQMVRVCDGETLPKADPTKVYLLRTFGNLAHEVWDVTVPESPRRAVTVVDKLRGTHKNWWECDTGIAYPVSGLPDWRTRRLTQIFDLSDPAHPVFIRNFGLPGQQPGVSGPVPTEHYLLSPQVGRLDLPAWNGAHTALPILGMDLAEFARDKIGGKRDFLLVVDESLVNECLEARQMAWFVDVTDERQPVSVATFNVPEADGGFCSRGGRFGSHSSNENQPAMYAKRIVFVAWFNAGVRAVDIRNPFHPREIGHYIPATTDRTDRRCIKAAAGERCKVAIQTNNVDVDDRGYVYIVNRANTGLHILELTGEARAAAKF